MPNGVMVPVALILYLQQKQCRRQYRQTKSIVVVYNGGDVLIWFGFDRFSSHSKLELRVADIR